MIGQATGKLYRDVAIFSISAGDLIRHILERPLQRLNKWGQVVNDDRPHDAHVDSITAVDRAIAQTNDLRPPYSRYALLLIAGNSVGSFPDDLKKPHKSQAQLAIGIQRGAIMPLGHRHRFPRVLKHVNQRHQFADGENHPVFDVAPDGKRVVAILDETDAKPDRLLRVLLNADHELHRRGASK